MAILATVAHSYAYYERGQARHAIATESESEKKPSYEDMFNESMNFFPADTPPIVREFLKDPDNDDLAKWVVKYFNQRTDTALRAGQRLSAIAGGSNLPPTAAMQHGNNIDMLNLQKLSEMRQNGFQAIYFFNRHCPACIRSKDTVRIISRFLPVREVDAMSENSESLFTRWRVARTPTMFFIRGGDAYKMVGEITPMSLHQFLQGVP